MTPQKKRKADRLLRTRRALLLGLVSGSMVLFGHITPGQAQTPTKPAAPSTPPAATPPPSPPPSPPVPTTKGFFIDIWTALTGNEQIKIGVQSLITLLAGAAITAAVAGVTAWQQKKKVSELKVEKGNLEGDKSKLEQSKSDLEYTKSELEQTNTELVRRLAGVRFGLPETYTESYNRVLLVGLGGSGKTTLIRHLTGNKGANPRIKTGSLRTYSLVHEIVYKDEQSDFSKSHLCRIDIDDYRGQEPSQIVAGWDATPPEGAEFACTSIVFMVDLFSDSFHSKNGQKPQAHWEDSRIDQHIREWSPGLIRTIVAKATPGNLKYICLFINKIDVLKAYHGQKDDEIVEKFKSIDQALQSVSADALYEKIIGSADKHLGVSFILNRLVEVSSPAGSGS